MEETSGARQVRVQVERAAPGVIGSVTGWRLQATATARVEGSSDNATTVGGE